MKKFIYIISVFFTAVSLVSCEKELMNFDNEDVDVYFSSAGVSDSRAAIDTTYLSFANQSRPDSILNVFVSITGVPVDHDREYKLVINPSSNAQAGIHYEALPEKFVISKNKLKDTIQVKLFRTPDMANQSFILVFDLLANENFGTSWKTRQVQGGIPVSTIKYQIRVDDKVKQPVGWNVSYFGTFTREKLYFLIDFLKLPTDNLNKSSSPFANPSDAATYGRIAQRELYRLQNEGKTVYEADGVTKMQMGTSSL